MTGPSVIQHVKGMLHKWLGPNRGTHWTIAGSVAVIMLGGYLIYSISAAERTPAPMTPAPPASVTSKK
jgi:hypothetical protein